MCPSAQVGQSLGDASNAKSNPQLYPDFQPQDIRYASEDIRRIHPAVPTRAQSAIGRQSPQQPIQLSPELPHPTPPTRRLRITHQHIHHHRAGQTRCPPDVFASHPEVPASIKLQRPRRAGSRHENMTPLSSLRQRMQIRRPSHMTGSPRRHPRSPAAHPFSHPRSPMRIQSRHTNSLPPLPSHNKPTHLLEHPPSPQITRTVPLEDHQNRLRTSQRITRHLPQLIHTQFNFRTPTSRSHCTDSIVEPPCESRRRSSMGNSGETFKTTAAASPTRRPGGALFVKWLAAQYLQ